MSDPDRLFNDPAYLNAVLDGDASADGGDPPGRWTLLVLEDCDELLRPDAKQASGQALGRLLNLTDGMVGQGLRVLVCLTTNEELWRLHPAVTRPGRCLGQLEVGRFTRTEAAAWLQAPDVEPSPATDQPPLDAEADAVPVVAADRGHRGRPHRARRANAGGAAGAAQRPAPHHGRRPGRTAVGPLPLTHRPARRGRRGRTDPHRAATGRRSPASMAGDRSSFRSMERHLERLDERRDPGVVACITAVSRWRWPSC
ncbi:MAG: hypothetical protein R2749_16065 [Acidimicrobiales bacterium]